MQKQKLIELKEPKLYHGCVFRAAARPPNAPRVDLMLFDTQSEERPYGLMVVSGYKAGLIFLRLPKESCGSDGGGGVETAWMIANWNKFYLDCDVAEVEWIEQYEIVD
ncbi:Imm45 family immunity protein [Pseudomonas xanthosomatis]|uniref:Imm45 family immunity protein n=1 Tax=Pseudomonas xanthosomatis TaxID=2842356 RepID=UPI003511549E